MSARPRYRPWFQPSERERRSAAIMAALANGGFPVQPTNADPVVARIAYWSEVKPPAVPV